MKNRSYALVVLSLALTGGCSTREPVPATEVLNHGNCTMNRPGMKAVTYSEVAALRGSALLNMTSPAPNAGSDLILVAISRGPQPTPGYRFDLVDAYAVGDTATIRLRWSTPPQDAVLPQVITHPCIVVGVGGDYARIRAVDDQGSPLGELSRGNPVSRSAD